MKRHPEVTVEKAMTKYESICEEAELDRGSKSSKDERSQYLRGVRKLFSTCTGFNPKEKSRVHGQSLESHVTRIRV